MKPCPCNSNEDYLNCCGLYLSGQTIPPNPEALMRSRYTAYSMANIAYIKKTMRGKPLTHFDELEAKRWASEVQWLGLQVIKFGLHELDAQIGFVEFIATYLEQDILKTIHENSEFHCMNNHWFYVDGLPTKTIPKKIPRNATCPCRSQKKFKNCHARS